MISGTVDTSRGSHAPWSGLIRTWVLKIRRHSAIDRHLICFDEVVLINGNAGHSVTQMELVASIREFLQDAILEVNADFVVSHIDCLDTKSFLGPNGLVSTQGDQHVEGMAAAISTQ